MNILPSYKCNLACPFCIIHKMNNNDLLDLNWLQDTIKDIQVKQIDILGGEPSLLDDKYLESLISICKDKLGGKKPGMYTNLVRVSPFINDVELTVSYDPIVRQKSSIVLSNMINLTVPFDINMIVTKYIVDMGARRLLSFANHLKNLKKLTLSTYTLFPGCNDMRPDYIKLAQFCKDIIDLDYNNKIHFYPSNTWKNDYIKCSDPSQTVEILPNKKFRIAIRDYLYVKEFDTYQEAAKYYNDNVESKEYQCIRCPYFKRCTHMYLDNNTCFKDKYIAKEIYEHIK